MTRRHRKHDDGKYHIDGHTYEELIGSRAKVWHGTAYKTTGGLTKKHLQFNKKTGRIVSKKKAITAKRQKHLGSLLAKRGQGFGPNRPGTRRATRGRRRRRRTNSKGLTHSMM